MFVTFIIFNVWKLKQNTIFLIFRILIIKLWLFWTKLQPIFGKNQKVIFNKITPPHFSFLCGPRRFGYDFILFNYRYYLFNLFQDIWMDRCRAWASKMFARVSFLPTLGKDFLRYTRITLILFYKQHIIKKTSWTVAYKTEWLYYYFFPDSELGEKNESSKFSKIFAPC